jgi:transcriptional regulator with XRE-family HTH domain
MTAALAAVPYAQPEGSPFALDLGKRLRKIREEAGKSLRQVEEDSEGTWPACVVGSYERAERGVTVDKLHDLCGFYGVPLRDVLDPPPLVADAFTAITKSARSGVTEQIRQRLLDEAEDSRYDDASVRVIVAMAELVGGAM